MSYPGSGNTWIRYLIGSNDNKDVEDGDHFDNDGNNEDDDINDTITIINRGTNHAAPAEL